MSTAGIRRFSDHILNQNKQLIEKKTDMKYMDYALFATVEESDYSSLPPYASKQVYDILKEYFGNEQITIIDATAHIGADSVNFITRFNAHCISLEINEETYKCLQINIKTFSPQGHSNFAVRCNCADYLNEYKDWADFIYFDPPWGGHNYWEKKCMMLYIGDIPIYNIINNCLGRITKCVVLKIPSNFDTALFYTKIKRGTCVDSYDVMKPKKKRSNRAYISFRLLIITIKN